MRGARLTLSSTPSCPRYRFTIICEIWADKERNLRKQGGLYINFSFLFLNANIRRCLYPVTPLLLPFNEFIFNNKASLEGKKKKEE